MFDLIDSIICHTDFITLIVIIITLYIKQVHYSCNIRIQKIKIDFK